MPAMAAPLLRNPTPTPSRAPSSAAAAVAHAAAQPPPPRTAQSNAHHAPHLYSVAFSETGKTVSTFLYSQCIYLNMQNINLLRGKSLSLNRLHFSSGRHSEGGSKRKRPLQHTGRELGRDGVPVRRWQLGHHIHQHRRCQGARDGEGEEAGPDGQSPAAATLLLFIVLK